MSVVKSCRSEGETVGRIPAAGPFVVCILAVLDTGRAAGQEVLESAEFGRIDKRFDEAKKPKSTIEAVFRQTEGPMPSASRPLFLASDLPGITVRSVLNCFENTPGGANLVRAIEDRRIHASAPDGAVLGMT